jgi:hypothetical protein
LEELLQERITPTTPEAGKPDEDELDEIADDIIKNFQLSTNLIFGNSKQSIEVLADRLHERVRREKWPADPFVVHHGSLSKDLREDAEATLKSGVPTTALCSSTLEMGIDIGNVRAVGQVDTPWSVSSMVQRLGRSGRRAGEAAVMRMYVREDSPNSRSTLTDLLRGLADHDLVEQLPQGELILALAGERITGAFDFYAAFQSTEEFVIRCGAEEIGKLPADIIPPVGEHLILAGKRWRVEKILPNQKLVFVVFSPGCRALPFQGRAGEIHTRVVREMKTVLLGEDEPAYLDQNSKLLLCRGSRLNSDSLASMPDGISTVAGLVSSWGPSPCNSTHASLDCRSLISDGRQVESLLVKCHKRYLYSFARR